MFFFQSNFITNETITLQIKINKFVFAAVTVIENRIKCSKEERRRCFLSVRFLVSCTGTWTTELLWLASSWIGNDQCFVVLAQNIFNLLLGCFINNLKDKNVC